jgi:hypothetical protein
MRSFIVWSALACVVGVSAGCGGAEEAPPTLDEYFAAVPYPNAACNVVDQRLAGEREVHLFVNGDVDLLPITKGLASYYRRHSLSFVTPSPPDKTPMAYAMDTDLDGLMTATVAAFPDVDFSNSESLMSDPMWPQVQAFIANYIYRPLIDFATAHAAGPNVTNVAVIPNLERPGGELSDPTTTLAGLSVSPALLAEFLRMMNPDDAVWQDIELPSGFTPMVLLGGNILASLGRTKPVLEDLVAAHEFGHSAGLVHDQENERNLMYPTFNGMNDCTDSLTDQQLDIMRTNLNLGTAASGASTPAQVVARFRSAFTPAHARALLAGDRRAMRPLLELLVGAQGGARD